MAIFGYARVSTSAQATEGESLDAQERRLRGWAAAQYDADLAEMFIETAISGSVPFAQRPEGARLLARVKSGDVILATRLDRAFRSAFDALGVVESLRERGVGLVLLDLGGDVVSNGMSKMFLTIAAAFAEAERDRIRERISGAKADAKARGRYLGGTVPFGYKVDAETGMLISDETEQAIITRVQEMFWGGVAEKGRPPSVRARQAAIAEEFGRTLSLATINKFHDYPDEKNRRRGRFPAGGGLYVDQADGGLYVDQPEDKARRQEFDAKLAKKKAAAERRKAARAVAPVAG
jgi:putative DNA-invertase from lambdoid prophage Rac